MRSSSGRPDAWYFLAMRHDETQVRLHEGALGVLALTAGAAQLALASHAELGAGVELGASLVAGFDRLGEADFVVLGEQRVLTDVGEVETDEVFFVPLDTLFGHRRLTPRFADNACTGR